MITPGPEMEHNIDRIAVLATCQGAMLDIVGGRPHDGSFVREMPDAEALGSKSQGKT